MKNRFCIISAFLLLSLAAGSLTPLKARDFVADFMAENYKETQASFSYSPLIYHSIQVSTGAGPKVLILEGDDYNYRTWLRQFIAQGRKLILKVDDKRSNEFLTAKAFSMDVTAVHPLDPDHWGVSEEGNQALTSTNRVLVVDTNATRAGLIKTIITRMGFEADIHNTWAQALQRFKLGPAAFRLVIAHHKALEPDQKGRGFVDQVIQLNHTIPVLIDTGYRNEPLKLELTRRYRKNTSVHVKPVVLKELSKTVDRLATRS